MVIIYIKAPEVYWLGLATQQGAYTTELHCTMLYWYLIKCLVSIIKGARCISEVRAFAHGAMGYRIDPSWWTHWAISHSSQCSTTGVCGMVHIKDPLLLIGKSSHYLNGPLPYVRHHITVNKMSWVHPYIKHFLPSFLPSIIKAVILLCYAAPVTKICY